MDPAVLLDNLPYLLWGAYPDGPLGGAALTLILSIGSALASAVLGALFGVALALSHGTLRNLLTLFLGFAKRRAELSNLAQDAAQHRAVLGRYTISFLDRAIGACAAVMAVTYALYTLSAETAALHGTGDLVLTLPWVLLGTVRYLYRLRFRGGGGDPTEELLRDPLLGASVLGWIATVLWVIG